jgi:hypothetical protein
MLASHEHNCQASEWLCAEDEMIHRGMFGVIQDETWPSNHDDGNNSLQHEPYRAPSCVSGQGCCFVLVGQKRSQREGELSLDFFPRGGVNRGTPILNVAALSLRSNEAQLWKEVQIRRGRQRYGFLPRQ